MLSTLSGLILPSFPLSFPLLFPVLLYSTTPFPAMLSALPCLILPAFPCHALYPALPYPVLPALPLRTKHAQQHLLLSWATRGAHLTSLWRSPAAT